jgi:hypothetical protein
MRTPRAAESKHEFVYPTSATKNPVAHLRAQRARNQALDYLEKISRKELKPKFARSAVRQLKQANRKIHAGIMTDLHEAKRETEYRQRLQRLQALRDAEQKCSPWTLFWRFHNMAVRAKVQKIAPRVRTQLIFEALAPAPIVDLGDSIVPPWFDKQADAIDVNVHHAAEVRTVVENTGNETHTEKQAVANHSQHIDASNLRANQAPTAGHWEFSFRPGFFPPQTRRIWVPDAAHAGHVHPEETSDE